MTIITKAPTIPSLQESGKCISLLFEDWILDNLVDAERLECYFGQRMKIPRHSRYCTFFTNSIISNVSIVYHWLSFSREHRFIHHTSDSCQDSRIVGVSYQRYLVCPAVLIHVVEKMVMNRVQAKMSSPQTES
ncbi:uncharacterized protein EAF01_011263 [Botrytis porri]|uniref:uncharacterized protein n=1 Tax=Botrytis porri TaxID=87229 RepID=UPI001900345A|nr:uncharacterized protein EAF01_011263 [Botrytis porri]KAF7886585.1 hypothetical protein EAF01_011263 [Botrytis porri]